MSLHDILVQLHDLFPSRLTRSLFDYSCRVASSYCSSGDFEDLNRVRFFTKAFQLKQGCASFQLPCKSCGKAEKSHPWQRTCPRRHMLAGRKVFANNVECDVCKLKLGLNTNISSCKQCNFDMCDDCAWKYSCQSYTPGPPNGPCVCGKLAPSHPVPRTDISLFSLQKCAWV